MEKKAFFLVFHFPVNYQSTSYKQRFFTLIAKRVFNNFTLLLENPDSYIFSSFKDAFCAVCLGMVD